MKRALVRRNIVDLLAEPEFHAERKSQLLFGEGVTVSESSGDYARVVLDDGYEGWTLRAGLCEVSEKIWARKDDAFQLRISTPVAQVHDQRGAPVRPYFLPYGSVIYPAETEIDDQEKVEIAAPDGLRRWVSRDDLAGMIDATQETIEDLQESIMLSTVQFLGVPYLWGGRSPLGYDCSGLAQVVYGMHGIRLPRDSKDQRAIGREIARKDLAPGDLIFSPGHVVIYMEAGRFIHASAGEGGVEVNSYDANDSNYREDLDKEYDIARRVIGPALND